MGLAPAPEPWVFLALRQLPDGTYGTAPNPSLGGKSAQMFSKPDRPQIFPQPLPTNLNPISARLGIPPAERRGVATAVFFEETLDLDALAVIGQKSDSTPIRAENPPIRVRDIPDIVANPERTHFFSADCISCHTESRIRKTLSLPASDLAYHRPEGLSGIDENVLPAETWNVRNFGWFPSFFKKQTV